MIHSLVSRVMAEAKPEKRLVNTFPFLKYFPGQWKGDGRRYHQEELAFFQQQMDGVRELIKNGEDPNCFGKYVIEHQAGELSFPGLNWMSLTICVQILG